jgi:hypothetical protein
MYSAPYCRPQYDDPFKKAETEKAEIDALYGTENTGGYREGASAS